MLSEAVINAARLVFETTGLFNKSLKHSAAPKNYNGIIIPVTKPPLLLDYRALHRHWHRFARRVVIDSALLSKFERFD